jgi:hypothetical protein
MSLSSVLALLCANVFGQGFGQLATNRDGSILYFSSPLRMRGSDQYLHPKIFTWERGNGIRLYEQRASDLPFPIPLFFGGTQFFSLVAPDVSSDGSTVAITGILLCHFSDECALSIEEFQSTIYSLGKPAVIVPGSAVLSRNGRYALLRSSKLSPPGWPPPQVQLLDLITGHQTTYTGRSGGGKHLVANDGTVVIQDVNGRLALGQGGKLNTVGSSSAFIAQKPSSRKIP